MFGLPSVAIALVTKVGLGFAKKRKWLPKGFYHRLSIESLRDGDFNAAMAYNTLARQKDPTYDKAMVVHDILRMNRDAHIEELRQQAEEHMLTLGQLRLNRLELLDQLHIIRTRQRNAWWKGLMLLVLFFLVLAFGWFIGFRFEIKSQIWLLPAVASGILLGCVALKAFRGARDRKLDDEHKVFELREALKEIDQDVVFHHQRLQILGDKVVMLSSRQM